MVHCCLDYEPVSSQLPQLILFVWHAHPDVMRSSLMDPSGRSQMSVVHIHMHRKCVQLWLMHLGNSMGLEQQHGIRVKELESGVATPQYPMWSLVTWSACAGERWVLLAFSCKYVGFTHEQLGSSWRDCHQCTCHHIGEYNGWQSANPDWCFFASRGYWRSCTTSITRNMCGPSKIMLLAPAHNHIVTMSGVVVVLDAYCKQHTPLPFSAYCALMKFSRFKHMILRSSLTHASVSLYHSARPVNLEVGWPVLFGCLPLPSLNTTIQRSSLSYCMHCLQKKPIYAQFVPWQNGWKHPTSNRGISFGRSVLVTGFWKPTVQ